MTDPEKEAIQELREMIDDYRRFIETMPGESGAPGREEFVSLLRREMDKMAEAVDRLENARLARRN
jgi:hypothetical protein